MAKFSNILLFCDANIEQSTAIKRAAELANDNQAALTVCAIVDAVPSKLHTAITVVTPAELIDIAVTEQRRWLEQTLKNVIGDGVTIEIKILVGKPYIEVIRQVLKSDHDLVIKCADRDTGLRTVLFGGTDMNLLRNCPCPVWIVKSTENQQTRRILAAVDQDPEDPAKDDLNRQILEISTSLASAQSRELHIIHAWSLFGESYLRSPGARLSHAEVDEMVAGVGRKRENWLENLVQHYATKADEEAIESIAPQRYVIKGDAKQIVPLKARELDVDLVVMGTVARTGINGFIMGNTAESILTQLDCSVLTVKPSEFISPITL